MKFGKNLIIFFIVLLCTVFAVRSMAMNGYYMINSLLQLGDIHHTSKKLYQENKSLNLKLNELSKNQNQEYEQLIEEQLNLVSAPEKKVLIKFED